MKIRNVYSDPLAFDDWQSEATETRERVPLIFEHDQEQNVEY